jgi:hypothetical protein
MLEGKMAEVPGCMASPATFPYPVLRRVVAGSRPPRSAEEAAAMLPRYREAGRDLAELGIAVLTENCNGRVVLLQRHLAAAAAVPVVTSALLLVPTVARLLPGRRIGILAFDPGDLGAWHYRACGFGPEEVPLAVAGVAHCASWRTFLATKEAPPELAAALAADLVAVARELLAAHPDLGALVAECTLLPPFTQAVRDAHGLPVFDVLSLLDLAMSGCSRLASRGAGGHG